MEIRMNTDRSSYWVIILLLALGFSAYVNIELKSKIGDIAKRLDTLKEERDSLLMEAADYSRQAQAEKDSADAMAKRVEEIAKELPKEKQRHEKDRAYVDTAGADSLRWILLRPMP